MSKVIFELDEIEEHEEVKAHVYAVRMWTAIWQIRTNLWRSPLKWGGVDETMRETIKDMCLTEDERNKIIVAARGCVKNVINRVNEELEDVPWE